MQLNTRFRNVSAVRSSTPLSNDEIAAVAPSIFAADKHDSRSERYTYIPTIDVLDGLRREGFSPFMACQSRVRDAGKREHTKHMLRLRHANQISGREANEIILVNSHDGSTSYQMLAGCFRFVCHNGLVCGDTTADIRIRHKGDVVHEVIEGAFKVLDGFETVTAQREAMRSTALRPGEGHAFAVAALALRYDEATPSPVTEDQILTPRRVEDRASDLWTTYNRVQENLTKGGLRGWTVKRQRTSTRPVTGIDNRSSSIARFGFSRRSCSAYAPDPTAGQAPPARLVFPAP